MEYSNGGVILSKSWLTERTSQIIKIVPWNSNQKITPVFLVSSYDRSFVFLDVPVHLDSSNISK